jgi:enediyne biosynthesis protein E4
LLNLGMVTDALWSDFNNDNKIDLIVVGELMPITFFKNNGNTFVNITKETGIGQYKGWWNSISAGDCDGDGDIDYIAGNVGLNHYYKASEERPVKIVAKDFDNNGSIDPIISCYFMTENGEAKLCPVHFWDDLISLSPKFRKQFNRYKAYGKASTERLLSDQEMEGALTLEGNCMASSYIENIGDGKFNMKALPVSAQFSPINGILVEDFNDDGKLDMLVCGNDYGNETFSGRLDASFGLFLTGDGKGNFTAVRADQSGFVVKGDAKALTKLYDKSGREMIVATQNKDSLRVFSTSNIHALFSPGSHDRSIEFVLDDGQIRKTELYYGSGFLSQSSRKVKIPENTKEIIVTDFRNRQRKTIYSQTAKR